MEPAVALGEGHPCLELMDEIGMLAGKPGDNGREMVIRFADVRCQVSVCPFKSIKEAFLGLKTLQEVTHDVNDSVFRLQRVRK